MRGSGVQCEGPRPHPEARGSGPASEGPPSPPCVPRFRSEDYTVHVRLGDYLDIICPHYEPASVADADMEQYTLYLVEREQYQLCQPQSKNQVRWQCDRPSARHGPEKLSEKFQRFTPFTLGKEFKEGHSYYYICECQGRARRRPCGGTQLAGAHVARLLSGASGRQGGPFQSWLLFHSFMLQTDSELLLCAEHSAWHDRHRASLSSRKLGRDTEVFRPLEQHGGTDLSTGALAK